MVWACQLKGRDCQAGQENHDPTLCCLQEIHCKYEDINSLKVKGQKKMYHTNNNHNEACTTIIKSDNVDFRSRNIIRNKDGYFLIIKGSIHQEYITILSVYTSNNKASKIHKAKTDTTKRKNSQIQNHG